MSRLTRSTFGVMLAASCAVASAATLKLENGARISIEAGAVRPSAFSSLGATSAPLRYSVVDQDGHAWTGDVPGSAGTQASDVTVAQDPLSGDVFTVFARPSRGGTQLVSSRWSGQIFSDPAIIEVAGHEDRRPSLAFGPAGDALLAYFRGAADGALLLRHYTIGVSGNVQTYTFVDVGAPSSFLAAQASPDILRPARIEGVTEVPGESAAYVFVTRGSQSAVVRLELDSLMDPGGAGAAPVPVEFIRTTANSASSSPSFIPGSSIEGAVIEPWRMSLDVGGAWYWTRDNQVDLVTFRGGEMRRLVSFATPATDALLHAEAFRVARAELGLGLRRPGLSGGSSDLARRSR